MYELLFDDLQDFHGAGLDADTAGNALGNRIICLVNHDLGGAGFRTLAAAGAELLVDHVHTGLGVLGDGIVLTGFHTLAALNTGHRLSTGTLGNDLNAGKVRIKLLIESLGAGLNTLQAGHALSRFIDGELFHSIYPPFIDIDLLIIHRNPQIATTFLDIPSVRDVNREIIGTQQEILEVFL